MTPWKRAARVPSSLRRWITILRTVLHRWYRACSRRAFGAGRLSVEQLESIEAAGSLMLSTAGLAAVAVVRTAETHTPTPIAEKPAGIADWSQEASTEAERALSDRIFNLTTARNDASSENPTSTIAASQRSVFA